MATHTERALHHTSQADPVVAHPAEVFAVGRHLLGKGQYREALVTLKEAVERDPDEPLYKSCYGLCLVKSGRGKKEGLELCRQAVKEAFYHSDLYVNLAQAHLALGDRKRAVAALQEGACLELDHPEVHRLLSEMGQRRKPVLPFLSRGHPVNRTAGMIRHALFGSSQKG